MTSCSLCQLPVQDATIRSGYYCTQVIGWDLPRQEHQGGGSIFGRRKVPSVIAHVDCVKGTPRSQGVLAT